MELTTVEKRDLLELVTDSVHENILTQEDRDKISNICKMALARKMGLVKED